MLNFFIKIFVVFLSIISITYHSKIWATNSSDFVPYCKKLWEISTKYKDKETLYVLDFMINRLQKIIVRKSQILNDAPMCVQIYRFLVLPIVVHPFFQKFKTPELFPKKLIENGEICKLCFGKGLDGKYWCFVMENRGVVLKSYD